MSLQLYIFSIFLLSFTTGKTIAFFHSQNSLYYICFVLFSNNQFEPGCLTEIKFQAQSGQQAL